MVDSKIKYIKGAVSIVAAMAAPFGAYAMGEVSLRAAIILAIVAGIASIHTWLDQAFAGQDPVPDTVPAAVLVPSSPLDLLPHAEAHADSQHPDTSVKAPPDPSDVKEGSA